MGDDRPVFSCITGARPAAQMEHAGDLNAIFYVLRGGAAWSLLPREFPPKSTVFHWLSIFRDTCLFEKINHALVIADRERVSRQASPSAAIIDSQGVKTTESGGPRGYDVGKEVKGRKRHALVDTDGRGLSSNPIQPMSRIVTQAGRCCRLPDQSSLSSKSCSQTVRTTMTAFGPPPASPSRSSGKIAKQVGFVVLPRRWVVERFFAWINRNRRLAKDVETTINSARAFLYTASIMLLVRRLGRSA